MEFIEIPHLKQKVSRVALGTWAIGGWMWGGSDEKEAIATIRTALDRGINFIDTAPAYGSGHSEEVVGAALKAYGKREKIVLATKAGLPFEANFRRDSRKEGMAKELEGSLKRLKVDYIDIYLIHWPDPLVPFEEAAATMNRFMEQGKIRSVGVSNYSLEQIKAFRRGGPLHVVQPPYNLFERAIEKKELAYCLENGIATMGYGVLCRGMLSGKMSKARAFQADDLRKTMDPKFQEPRFSHYLECVAKLDRWAKEKHRRSVLALAVRWALDKGISAALWGARKPEQLNDLDAVWGWKLGPEDFREIDAILNQTIKEPIGPEFMSPPTRE